MAEIPRFGRSMRAPGPVPFSPNTGPLYNAGLTALGEFAGDLSGALAARDRELVDAYNSTEIIKRTAQYSLDVTDAAQRAAELRVSEPVIGPANADGTQPVVSRLASPEEQEEFFRAEVGKLEQQYGKWEKGIYGRKVSVEARTRLKNTMIAETAQQAINLRKAQRSRMMQEMEDRLGFSIQAAVQTNNPALLTESLEEASPILTEAKREQILAEFPVNVQLYQARQRMDMLDQSDIDPNEKIAGLSNLQTQLEDLREKNLTDEQRARATRMLEWARADTQATTVARDKAKREFVAATGRAVYADMTEYETSGGKSGKDYSIAQLGDLLVGDAIDRGTYDALVKIKTGESQPDPWSAFSAEVLITDVESGQKTAEEAMARQIELAPSLSVQERAQFNKDIAKARSSYRGHIRTKGERTIDDALDPGMYGVPLPASVNAVAKKQFWSIIREMEDKREVLDEDKLLTTAVDLALRYKREYQEDKPGFAARYGFTQVGEDPSGFDILMTRQPLTEEEFNRVAGSIQDEEKAKAYYEKWKDTKW